MGVIVAAMSIMVVLLVVIAVLVVVACVVRPCRRGSRSSLLLVNGVAVLACSPWLWQLYHAVLAVVAALALASLLLRVSPPAVLHRCRVPHHRYSELCRRGRHVVGSVVSLSSVVVTLLWWRLLFLVTLGFGVCESALETALSATLLTDRRSLVGRFGGPLRSPLLRDRTARGPHLE